MSRQSKSDASSHFDWEHVSYTILSNHVARFIATLEKLADEVEDQRPPSTGDPALRHRIDWLSVAASNSGAPGTQKADKALAQKLADKIRKSLGPTVRRLMKAVQVNAEGKTKEILDYYDGRFFGRAATLLRTWAYECREAGTEDESPRLTPCAKRVLAYLKKRRSKYLTVGQVHVTNPETGEIYHPNSIKAALKQLCELGLIAHHSQKAHGGFRYIGN